MNATTHPAVLDTQVTDIADDWKAPDFYRELDLEKARLVVKFGDLICSSVISKSRPRPT